MLSEIHAKLKIDDGNDATFIQEAICGGHLWALKDKFSGIFDTPEKPEHRNPFTNGAWSPSADSGIARGWEKP